MQDEVARLSKKVAELEDIASPIITLPDPDPEVTKSTVSLIDMIQKDRRRQLWLNFIDRQGNLIHAETSPAADSPIIEPDEVIDRNLKHILEPDARKRTLKRHRRAENTGYDTDSFWFCRSDLEQKVIARSFPIRGERQLLATIFEHQDQRMKPLSFLEAICARHDMTAAYNFLCHQTRYPAERLGLVD